MKSCGVALVQEAETQILGKAGLVDCGRIQPIQLSNEEFDKASMLAQAAHAAQFEGSMTNGGAMEVISLLLSLEFLALHVKAISMESRQTMLNTVVARALLHSKMLIDAYDKGDLKPAARRDADGTRHNTH